jgi:arylformamidase
VKLIDVSVPIRDGMPVYDNNPGVHLERARSIAEGDEVNISRLDFGVHTGTHVDAPVHFIEGGAGAEAIDPGVLIGEAHVVDATGLHADIDAEALATLELPPQAERLIFKTPNSDLWNLDAFTHQFIRFVESGARRLVDAGVRLVAIDYLSIGDGAAHRVFLGNGVVPLEGLDLRAVDAGPYRLYCLPLKVVGCDGAPARVLLEPLGASGDGSKDQQ